MTNLTEMTTPDLVALFNDITGKSVKVGSYPRAKLIEKIEAAAEETETVDNGGEPYEEVEDSVENRLAANYCPLCGAGPAFQTAAGEKGTFLEDSCNYCNTCNKMYNHFTGEEVPSKKAKKARSGKRPVMLNPQPKINAKSAALLEAGFELSYFRPERLWIIKDGVNDEEVVRLTPLELSEHDPKTIVDFAHAKAAE